MGHFTNKYPRIPAFWKLNDLLAKNKKNVFIQIPRDVNLLPEKNGVKWKQLVDKQLSAYCDRGNSQLGGGIVFVTSLWVLHDL